MRTRIATLLHMHQPDYRHPRTGVPVMPWVRLHATRGYTDVAALVEETGAAVTVNVAPSLLEQLVYYTEGGSDLWADLSAVPAEELDGQQVDFLRRRFVHGHPAMRRVSARYLDLERQAASGELAAPADVRDLQVWSNLAWVGFTGRKDPLVQGLIKQDRGFSHDQLQDLLAWQRACVAGVLARWRRLPSVSCSPRCHPILPLLIDFSHAVRSTTVPGAIDFAWPQDARRHVQEAVQITESILGVRPKGMWPSEGAVSPEAAKLIASEGFSWFATDQGILERSHRSGAPALSGPWRVEEGLVGLFRDRDLSDRISFQYQTWRGRDAAADLLNAAAGRYRDGAVVLALDGENPWECFPDAGEEFLRALFAHDGLLTVDEAAALPPAGSIQRLHTGSWINATLAVWAGDDEDIRAWRLVAEARDAWEAAGCPEAAWRHIAAAEGSDWFWWFGPEHSTEVHDLFDALFREHIAAAWEAMGHAAPAVLRHPVRR